MRVDQTGQRFGVGCFTDMPIVNQGELAQRSAATCLRHPGQAEIDAVGEHTGEQRGLVLAGAPGAPMREALGKAGPALDVEQDIGDADTRQADIERLLDGLDRGRRDRL